MINDMKNLMLSKNSGPPPLEIEAYFRKLLELKESGEKFPVDFDMVWPLAYSTKHKAVNELLNTKDKSGNEVYIKDYDYQALNQKVEAGSGLSTKVNYHFKGFVSGRREEIIEPGID